MAKPIFVIKLSYDCPQKSHDDISARMKANLFDWHVIVVTNNNSRTEFEAFSESVLQPIPEAVMKQLEAVIP